MTNLSIPKFATEADEAAWWDAHHEEAEAEFLEAAAEGRLMQGHLDGQLALLPAFVEVDSEDIEIAIQSAEAKGITSAEYLKSLLHEAIRQDALPKAG